MKTILFCWCIRRNIIPGWNGKLCHLAKSLALISWRRMTKHPNFHLRGWFVRWLIVSILVLLPAHHSSFNSNHHWWDARNRHTTASQMNWMCFETFFFLHFRLLFFWQKLIFYDIISTNEAPLIVSFRREIFVEFSIFPFSRLMSLSLSLPLSPNTLWTHRMGSKSSSIKSTRQRIPLASTQKIYKWSTHGNTRDVKCFIVVDVDLWKEFNCIHCADGAVSMM